MGAAGELLPLRTPAASRTEQRRRRASSYEGPAGGAAASLSRVVPLPFGPRRAVGASLLPRVDLSVEVTRAPRARARSHHVIISCSRTVLGELCHRPAGEETLHINHDLLGGEQPAAPDGDVVAHPSRRQRRGSGSVRRSRRGGRGQGGCGISEFFWEDDARCVSCPEEQGRPPPPDDDWASLQQRAAVEGGPARVPQRRSRHANDGVQWQEGKAPFTSPHRGPPRRWTDGGGGGRSAY